MYKFSFFRLGRRGSEITSEDDFRKVLVLGGPHLSTWYPICSQNVIMHFILCFLWRRIIPTRWERNILKSPIFAVNSGGLWNAVITMCIRPRIFLQPIHLIRLLHRIYCDCFFHLVDHLLAIKKNLFSLDLNKLTSMILDFDIWGFVLETSNFELFIENPFLSCCRVAASQTNRI